MLENRNSPTTYVNEERYAGVDVPAFATRDAEPDWVEVASDGRYSWHDHRAHWMQSVAPFGKSVGDRIVEDRIGLIVDGVEVDVEVISTWQPEPSPLPAIGGAAAALTLAAVAVFRWRATRAWMLVLAPLATLAVVAGVAQYTSLPSETGPRLVWIALPIIAVVATIAAVVSESRTATLAAHGAALIAAVQLVVWGLVKRDGLTAAIVPTSAPGWFDRLAVAGALVGGVALVALALVALFGPQPRPGEPVSA